LPWASATAQVTPRGRIDRSFRSRGASILWGKNMTEFELLAQAAASAANIPNVPLVIKLAEIGFGEMRNARVQSTLDAFEIERAFKRLSARALSLSISADGLSRSRAATLSYEVRE
jgi:hypothetical protein